MTGRVFVTVGTTGFDDLVGEFTSPAVQHELVRQGYSDLVVQYGTSQAMFDTLLPAQGLKVRGYSYKADIASDVQEADLVISHAGSGSILECLELGKPLVAVVNTRLMDNHQQELAEALAERNHLVATTPDSLLRTLQERKYRSLKPFPPSDPTVFARLLDSC
ncbi:N-acetylglucosaminyldiphosphodolichol N-acetylglucosaminyltransferase catalytic subunit alg13 [Dispira parvispora]|uniref:UDP-N-acetylglucosamine transferase subunit ALG13 n=1 Tax=Dispira parvispora TaxID=1520584 RepID=A0A9W8E0Z2_9FUNG|nr:N-acetylglucosaminyldiphosphodolichol N-acetylglucosaminyltransferase catalytic subunit alg13 [Dispira parvispora]